MNVILKLAPHKMAKEGKFTHAAIDVDIAADVEVVEGDVSLGVGAGRGLRPRGVVREGDPVASHDGS